MNRTHLVPCAVGLALAVAVLLAFGVDAGSLAYVAVALACPLMMVLMMWGMVGHHRHTDRDPSR